MASAKWIVLTGLILLNKIIIGVSGIRLSEILFPNKCLENYGCFSNAPPFYHPILRPISLLPIDLKDFQTKFYLYRTPPEKRVLIHPNEDSLLGSGYNQSLGLCIFIHGFKMQFDENLLDATQNFLDGIKRASNRNIILVDWSASNKEPYFQAVANGRVIGAQVAELIHFLANTTGLDPKNVHIIGHSLGTHIAGWAGERVSNLGRITGLDPAGQYFEDSESEVRLDPTDANFVDIIHTNAARLVVQGLGIVSPIGHVDFYPNGGSNQPGCQPTSGSINIGGLSIPTPQHWGAIFDLENLKCSHNRSMELFLESAKLSSCRFIAQQCQDYTIYLKGNCSSNIQSEMGLFAARNPEIAPGSKFYLKTGPLDAFCTASK